jgi:hypothetical protein
MRFVMVAALVGISGGVAFASSATVRQAYHQIYPENAAQRRALDECFIGNNRFDRLEAAARDACYRQHQWAASAARARNFVDLWQSASLGRLPADDIRTVQQNHHYLDALSAAAR